MRKIGLYPDILIGAPRPWSLLVWSAFLQELAAAFHKFYDSCRVLDENKELSAERLGLIERHSGGFRQRFKTFRC